VQAIQKAKDNIATANTNAQAGLSASNAVA
jgi:hypothetical protein